MNSRFVLPVFFLTAPLFAAPPPPEGMVLVPAGAFEMGSRRDGPPNAHPARCVHVDAFFMDRCEVSKERWQSVQKWSAGNGYSIRVGRYRANGHPVHSITWYDAVKWCNARSEKEGLTPCYYTDDARTTPYRTGNENITNARVKWEADGYRLPTEAEWEKAARGGLRGARWPARLALSLGRHPPCRPGKLRRQRRSF